MFDLGASTKRLLSSVNCVASSTASAYGLGSSALRLESGMLRAWARCPRAKSERERRSMIADAVGRVSMASMFRCPTR